MFLKIKFNIKNIVTFFIILTIIFLVIVYSKVNLHCDEEDVITGAWLITKGWVIYRDFFCHHMPLPYFIMTVPIIINKYATVEFIRGFYYILLFIYFIFINFYTKNGLKNIWLLFYILILFLYFEAFSGYYILLADTLFALGALTIFVSVLNKPDCNFSLKEMIVVSISIFVCITSTLISVYPMIFLGLYYIGMRLFKNKKLNIQDFKFFGIVACPFLILGLYMLASGTFHDFWQNAFLFNTKYYSQYTGNDTPLTLITKHFKRLPEFFMLKNMRIISKCAFIFFILYNIKLLIEKKYNLAIFSFLYVYLLGMRIIWVHGAAYYYALFYIFIIMIKDLASCLKNKYFKYLCIFFLVVLPAILFFNENYNKHPFLPGLKIINHPIIYTKFLFKNKSVNSDNKINFYLSEDTKIWVAPLNPIIYFYLKSEPVNRNIFYLPWQTKIPKENEHVINCLEKNKVDIIIVDTESTFWGWGIAFKDYAKPVYNYIKENYYPCPSLGKNVYLRKKQMI